MHRCVLVTIQSSPPGRLCRLFWARAAPCYSIDIVGPANFYRRLVGRVLLFREPLPATNLTRAEVYHWRAILGSGPIWRHSDTDRTDRAHNQRRPRQVAGAGQTFVRPNRTRDNRRRAFFSPNRTLVVAASVRFVSAFMVPFKRKERRRQTRPFYASKIGLAGERRPAPLRPPAGQ